jgi:hypothetical protein
MLTADETTQNIELERDISTLHIDGIVGKKSAFSRDWAEGMRENMMIAFWSAIQCPGGSGWARSKTLVCRNTS